VVEPAAGLDAHSPVPAIAPRITLSAWLRRVFAYETWVLALSILYFLVLLPFAPDLGNLENLELIVHNMLPLCAVAIGQTLVLLTGGIDLSVTSIIALCSVGGAWSMTTWGLPGGLDFVVGSFVMLAIGAFVGWLNGMAITRLSMPPFMVTLATMMFGSGFAVYLTRSNGIPGLPHSLAVFSQEGIGPIPYALLVVAPVGILCHGFLGKTKAGRWLFAVGANGRAAQISGVPVKRVTLLAYGLCGVLAALSAVLYTGRLETGSPVLGQRVFLDVIGATVIGGTSLFGGRGSVLGTVYGVLFITLIDNSLNILGLSNFTILMIKGTVILFAALGDGLRRRRLGAGR